MKHSENEATILRVTESIDTRHLTAKRTYSTFLTAYTNGAPLDKVLWSTVSTHRIHKTIYVKLYPEDMMVDDLTRTKAFFRAKITLRIAGDRP